MEELRVFEAFAGYGSQAMALERLAKDYPQFKFRVVGISEIDKYAIQAYNAVHGETTNYGDISKIDWTQVPDFDLLTYSFPCFPAGTLVLTDRGYKEIENVTTDDNVITHTNNFRSVVKTMRKYYTGQLYTFNAMSFDKLVCTDEHPLYVRRRYHKGHKSIRCFHDAEWKQAKDVTKDDFLGYAINTKAELPQWTGVENNQWGHHRAIDRLSALFDNPIFWYIMGRYVGDGWKKTSNTGCGIIICCSERNEESLKQAIASLGWRYTENRDRTVTKLIVSSNELYTFVDRYGYKAHGKKIDAGTMNLPIEPLKGFIKGVIDSDGSVKNGLIRITSVSRELIYGLAQCVAKAYNRPFSIYHTKRKPSVVIEGRTCSQRDSYTITWKQTTDKQDKAFYEDGYIWFPVNGISHEHAELDVYNLSVDTDESYTANGCIVHNCTDISQAGQQKGFKEDSGTRSGLLWECRKAIKEKKPQFLLMENVRALVSKKFMPEFQKWLDELSEMGYSTEWKILNAKDFGIPQNRERVFAISILKNDDWFAYHFPKTWKLDKFLKDVLEKNVDENYYLSPVRLKGLKLSGELQNEVVNGKKDEV